MSAHDLHYALLRPPILHILRAAGFHATCTGVLDTLVDLAARYFALLASKTAIHALSNNNELMPTVMDVRMALQDAGALWPQRSVMEEQAQDEEDMRGVEGFIGWIKGEGNQEIRRIAGLVPTPEEVEEVGTEVKEDFLSALKKKHSKTGEESRYQGTALGKPAKDKLIPIEGGPALSIQDWEAQLREQNRISKSVEQPATVSTHTSVVSSPLSEL